MTAKTETEQTNPAAIIYVDGEEFMRCEPDWDWRALFRETVDRVGGEVALMVWKPRYGIYFREWLSVTASVPEVPSNAASA